MEAKDTINIDNETLARMCNASWAEARKNYQFGNKEAEGWCKELFIRGYHAALVDMRDLSEGMVGLDELLAKQE